MDFFVWWFVNHFLSTFLLAIITRKVSEVKNIVNTFLTMELSNMSLPYFTRIFYSFHIANCKVLRPHLLYPKHTTKITEVNCLMRACGANGYWTRLLSRFHGFDSYSSEMRCHEHRNLFCICMSLYVWP